MTRCAVRQTCASREGPLPCCSGAFASADNVQGSSVKSGNQMIYISRPPPIVFDDHWNEALVHYSEFVERSSTRGDGINMGDTFLFYLGANDQFWWPTLGCHI